MLWRNVVTSSTGVCRLCILGPTNGWKMNVLRSIKILGYIKLPVIQRCIPDDQNYQHQHCGNLRSCEVAHLWVQKNIKFDYFKHIIFIFLTDLLSLWNGTVFYFIVQNLFDNMFLNKYVCTYKERCLSSSNYIVSSKHYELLLLPCNTAATLKLTFKFAVIT